MIEEILGDEEPLTAKRIATDFDTKPDQADERYRDERVTLRGTVRKIDNVISAVVVRLGGIGGKYDGVHVEAKLQNRSDAEMISRKEDVLLEGRCDGLRTKSAPSGDELGLVMITDASVLE